MKLNNIKQTFLAGAALLSTISMSAADRFVNFKQGDLLLNANNRVEIYMDTNDCKGVNYAAHALLKDIKSVSGATATLTSDAGFLKKADTARPAILVGTIGHSAAIDQLVKHFKQGDLLLNANNRVEIYMDTNDCKGVNYAAHALLKDIKSVSGATATLTSDAGFLKKADTARPAILVGTIGHSAAIDQLVKQKRINGNLLKGKREKFIITLIDGQLVIAGSDRRGTIYGIYELSQQMGVSPWYDWADVPVEHHDSIFVNKGIYTDGEPAVRYRGIFLNDEAPCLTSWVKNTYGTGYGDHRFYQRVFELVLRLRGNMMWPAMWGWAFYADDPENEKTADEMGVVMSTSHHEPMARNHQEYSRNLKGWGPWNYQKNKANLQKFFREGIERMKGTEQIVTIGMRGDGDEAMSEEADTKLMTNIINDQRKIIADVTGRKASETKGMGTMELSEEQG